MAKVLFISREDVVKKTALGGNVDSDKFLQFVEQAQDTYILDLLGTKLYDKIVNLVNAGNLTGNYLTLVNEYIKPMLIHYSVSEFLPFLGYTIANGGIYKHRSENGDVASREDIGYLANKSLQKAKHYTDRYLKFMNYNAPNMFPEYYNNVNDDTYPSRDSNKSSWVL